MAEVAGLVLGGIPLAIWALEKYAEPYEEFTNYRNSIDTFRANLTLQNWQLQATLSNIGLDNEPSIKELRECFETKFPSISRELMHVVQHMDEVTARLMENLDIDVNVQPNGLPDKVQWEWHRVKRSFNTKKRNKVVEDLRHWNEDLRRSLEKPEVPTEDNTRKVQHLKRRFNIKRCNSIRQCLSSLHSALESGFQCACSPPHQAAIDLDWDAYEKDAARSFKVAVSYRLNSEPSHISDSWRKLHVTSEATATNTTTTTTTNPVPGFLTPSPPPARVPSPTSSFLSKVPRFKLVRVSPRTPPPSPTPPTTSGFIKDPDEDQGRKFSLSHHHTDSHKIVKIVPLKSLLSLHDHSTLQLSPYLSLSAKQCYGIAASTAWSVLHLSGSPWLSEGWDEKQANIFLEEGVGRREMLSPRPCASCIFSMPLSPEEQPAHDSMYKQLFPNTTVFALGILLIELCINKSMEEIRQANDSLTPTSRFGDYIAALGQLEEVRRRAGDSYRYAAERCVKFSFEGRDVYKDFDFSQFRQQFHDAVVAPVQATYLMLQDSRIPV
ncbi:hypothetical protein QQX98_012693 [Neonectria punicea]|uniref:DUF7580 domain-containing protein n=1 Tax=Neonectria punicea TaxID=979145 RepID=A0ABR1GIJ2_9HYPO